MSSSRISPATPLCARSGRGRAAILGAVALLVLPSCGGGKAAGGADSAVPGEGRRGLKFRADAPAADVALSGVYARSHAVVIGIDKYRHVPQLGGAVRDAREFARALEEHGFSVTLLLDEQATREAIAQELGDRLHARVGPDDRVVVFFAGHGFSTGNGETRMGYLLPIEGKRDAVRATSLSMSELQNWLAGYEAKHVMFLADACYSGLALSTRSTGLDPGTATYLQEITTKPVRFTLVAGRDDQEAHEDTQSGHGVFTRFVLEGLSGAADANRDGLVTSDELGVYVKPQVSAYVSQNFNSSQTPQTARSGMGEFVFFSKAQRVASAERPAPAAAPEPRAPEPAKTEPVVSPPVKTEPAAPPPARTEPAPGENAGKLPSGVTISGSRVTITTQSAPRFRDDMMRAVGDAKDKQKRKLREVLAGPPFNVPASRLETEAEAVYKATIGTARSGDTTDDGDRVIVVEYDLRAYLR